MNIETLPLFISLSEQLHYRKTSEQYHIPVSTLTRIIQRLESELNTTLFERSNRHVTLTEEGKRFYAFAKQTVKSYEELQSELHQQSPAQLKGELKLFSTVTAAYHILPPIIKAFRKKYPSIMTYLETGLVKTGTEQLIKGHVDFTIGILSEQQLNRFDCIKLLDTPLVFVTAKNTEYTEDLPPLIFPESGDLSVLIRQYLRQHKREFSVHSYVEGHEAILAMVSAGLGAAILPEIVVSNSHLKQSVSIQKLKDPLPVLEVGLFKKKAVRLSPSKAMFWGFCLEDV